MGINANNNKISQKSTDAHYPYYDGTQVAQVYYNGTLVWKKYVPLDFTFSGNTLTKYTGSATTVTIPSQYYTLTDIDGTIIYTSTAYGSAISVTAIGESAFEKNSTIQTVTIPSSVKTIGKAAFQFCYNLTTVNLSANLTSIGYCAFALTGLSSVSSYMYNATTIGQGAFAFRNGWSMVYPGDAIATRLLNSTLGTLADNNSSYKGYGTIYQCWGWLNVYKNSGSQTPSGTYSTTITLNTGLKTITLGSLSCAIGSNAATTSYIFNTTGTMSMSHTESVSGATNVSSATWSQAINLSETQKYGADVQVKIVATCLAKGSLITLADGTQKPVEKISYKDLLLVWDFETGSYDYQYPLAIIKGANHTTKYKITLEDSSYLEICGQHDIYDPVAHTFRVYGEGAINKVDQDYYVLKDLGNGAYECIKIISIEIISEPTTAYSIITGGTITAFANNIMVGMSTLNRSRIGNKNSFEKEFQNDKALCYTYNRFKEEVYDQSRKYLILGLNLHYVDYYNGVREGLRQLLAPFNAMLQPESKNTKYMCTIGLLDGDTLIESHHLEDEEIILPQITTKGKTKWYVVGEYKYLNPGDTYTINFSTVIRAV